MESEKARLRERFRAARLELSAAERRGASEAIVRRIVALRDWADAQTVALYWPLLDRGEVDVRPLLATGKTIGLPRVTAAHPPTMTFHAIRRAGNLVAGPWGIEEPPEAAPVIAPQDIDLIVVPALGAGRDGGRIGHGGGFYDAFLPTTDALRLGIVYAACLVDAVPTEPHDARLDAIVTEHEVLRLPGAHRNRAVGRP